MQAYTEEEDKPVSLFSKNSYTGSSLQKQLISYLLT